MSVQALNPYLNFDGIAEKAIALYEKALGARTQNLSRFGEIPAMKFGPEHAQRVMHARLEIGDGVIMISDTMPDHPVHTDGNVQVALQFTDAADMAKKFEALAEGGKVSFPIHDTFWGARFGMLTDQFGVRWMFNCETKAPASKTPDRA